MSIYNKWMKRVGTFIIPVFFITNFPVMAYKNRNGGIKDYSNQRKHEETNNYILEKNYKGCRSIQMGADWHFDILWMCQTALSRILPNGDRDRISMPGLRNDKSGIFYADRADT